MELLLWIAGPALVLLVLVLAANRRRRGGTDDASRPPSPGAPASGSPSTNHGPLGGGVV